MNAQKQHLVFLLQGEPGLEGESGPAGPDGAKVIKCSQVFRNTLFKPQKCRTKMCCLNRVKRATWAERASRVSEVTRESRGKKGHRATLGLLASE